MNEHQSKETAPIGEIHIDTDLSAYEGFFDRSWAEKALSVVTNTKLEHQMENLCITWKGISHARRLPWLMMYGLQVQQEHSNDLSIAFPLQVIDLFIQRLSHIIEKRHVSLSPRTQKILREELKNVQDELIKDHHQRNSTEVAGHIKQLWPDFAQLPELAFGLWMSEVNAYTTVYFAYETFLIDSIKVVYPNEQYLRVQQLKDFFRRTNNEHLQRNYWAHKPIEKARLIRHAVSHNGRKLTSELESKFKNELTVTTNKEIVIKARDTTQLYQMLKDKAAGFSEEMIKVLSSQ